MGYGFPPRHNLVNFSNLPIIIRIEFLRSMPVSLLTDSEIAQLNLSLPNWQCLDGKLKRVWKFDDFSQAFAFMVRVALLAEVMGHHPNWSNVWNLVTIELTTHDLAGLTNLDVEFAEKINQISGD